MIYQFKRAQLQTDRLTGVSQQLIAVLRLQETLRTFHQQLNELAQSKDAHRLITEAEPLRAALRKQTQQTRSTLAYLPPEFRVDPAFQTALDTIEVTLPFQLDDIAGMAEAGDGKSFAFASTTNSNELRIRRLATSRALTANSMKSCRAPSRT